MDKQIPTDDAGTWKGNFDGGSCCNSAEAFVK